MRPTLLRWIDWEKIIKTEGFDLESSPEELWTAIKASLLDVAASLR